MATFDGKVVVLSGGGRGIGLAMAKSFAAKGAKLAILTRTESSCQAAADAINAEYAEAAKPYAVDVSDSAAVDAVAKEILSDFGGINVLINNAGITRDGLLMRMKEADWDAVLDTNLKGAFNMTKAFQRPLMKSADPRIINVASVIGLMGNAGQANYAASKAGLIGFTKSVARELAGKGVTCNAIAPGFIQTDMTDVLDDKVKEGIQERIPLKSFGQVEDVAALATFLASEEARYITGQVIATDGGMTM
ncbi:MAG: 3-oxoacyl-[acyl-carrier-protein] reductase [Verrucomicrobiota bacterium JB023]|nr:3-oxoacyl-[acyl-carrier-protein] reductase [Verrucomicrobiota bacterium JB023]